MTRTVCGPASRRLRPALHAAVLLALLAACGDDSVSAPPVATNIALQAPRTTIEVGEPLSVSAIARDTRDSVIADAAIVWSASPISVATVDDGVVTGVAPGTAAIQATVGAASATLIVNVVPAAVTSLDLSAPTTSLQTGNTVTIAGVVRDARQTPLVGRAITWSSTDTRRVLVSAGGVATAVTSGSAYIVARSENAIDSLLLTVAGGAPTLEVAPVEVELPLGRTRVLTARLRDAAGELTLADNVTWSSDREDLATVADGVITAVSPGMVSIRAQRAGQTAMVTVRVTVASIVATLGGGPVNDQVIRADSVHVSGSIIVSGPLTIAAGGDIVISGSITSQCQPITLLAGGRVIVTGPRTSVVPFRLDNSCDPTNVPTPAPAIHIEAGGGYVLANSRIRSTGAIGITNDAGLLSSDFQGAPLDRGRQDCLMDNVTIDQASVAAPTVEGASGRDGARIDIACRGTLRAAFTNINAIGGADGAAAMGASSARGGDGGRSGTIRFRVTGDVIVDQRRLFFRVFSSGKGGAATVLLSGTDGAAAIAVGGRGGDVGAPDLPPIEFRVSGDVIDNDPVGGNVIEMGLFISGVGGNATAAAAAGRDATAATPAGAGGPATAIGGRGGFVYPSIVSVGGNLRNGDLLLLGQGSGNGGSAISTGGQGGMGSDTFPNGAPGGAVLAEGGDGGTTTGVNINGTASRGGNGGAATIQGGIGGAGFDRCGPPGVGGVGGMGGRISGRDGRGGAGQTAGDAGGLTINIAANGGRGGRGSSPGAGGPAGADSTQATGARTVTAPSLLDGAVSGACPPP